MAGSFRGFGPEEREGVDIWGENGFERAFWRRDPRHLVDRIPPPVGLGEAGMHVAACADADPHPAMGGEVLVFEGPDGGVAGLPPGTRGPTLAGRRPPW